MSILKVTALQDTAGVEVYTGKIWVNFNGVGVVAIRDSGNVSGMTDGGVGFYGVNFSVIQPDASWAYHHAYTAEVNVQVGIGFLSSVSTTALGIGHYNPANSANTVDKGVVAVTIYR